VKLSVTPDRLIAKRHWATGEPAFELYLSQVQLDETPRAIVVAKRRRKLRIGTALKPEERHAVVAFLRAVIEGHVHSATPAATGGLASGAELARAES
jgi:hypothetical protein